MAAAKKETKAKAKVVKTKGKLAELKANVLKIHWDIVTGKETDTSKLRKAKREVAKYLTESRSNLTAK